MKRFIKIISFIFICAIISYLFSFSLTPSSYLRVVLHEVKTSQNPYDLVFIGQSRGESNINPYMLDKKMDYNSYNLCRRNLKMTDLPYLLKEANSENQIKACVIDIGHAYFYDVDPNYYSDSFIYPHISNVSNKFEYFLKYLLKADYRVFLMRYTVAGLDDLKMSKIRINQKLSKEYEEYSMDAVTERDIDHVYVGRGYHKGIDYANSEEAYGWDRSKVKEEALSAVHEVIEYCKKNNIKVVAINDPYPHNRFTVEEYADQREFFEDFFEKEGIEFLDFNYLDSSYLTWDDIDFSDSQGHMMGDMADRYALVLGEVLQKTFKEENVEEYYNEFLNN